MYEGQRFKRNVLLEAGAKTADFIIAATSRDEINMLCCLTAKKLGITNSIARIRDPEYTYELSMLRGKMGLSMVNGRVEIVSFRVLQNDMRLIGIPLSMFVNYLPPKGNGLVTAQS